ncbi:unnamed protein product, partial [Ectocarpus sp. 6 AP-2014]
STVLVAHAERQSQQHQQGLVQQRPCRQVPKKQPNDSDDDDGMSSYVCIPRETKRVRHEKSSETSTGNNNKTHTGSLSKKRDEAGTFRPAENRTKTKKRQK